MTMLPGIILVAALTAATAHDAGSGVSAARDGGSTTLEPGSAGRGGSTGLDPGSAAIDGGLTRLDGGSPSLDKCSTTLDGGSPSLDGSSTPLDGGWSSLDGGSTASRSGLKLAYISRIPVKGGKFVSTLQEAIDSTPDHSTLTLPSGVYGERVMIRKRHGLKIVAPNGPAYLLVRTVEKEPLIQIEDSSDLTFDNLWLRRDIRNPTGEPFYLRTLAAYSSSGLTFHRVYVDGHAGQPMEFSGCDRVTLDEVLVENGAMGVAYGWKEEQPLKGDGLTITRSRISAKQSPLSFNTSFACDWMPPVDKPLPGLNVTDSLLSAVDFPSVCPQHVFGMKGNVIVAGYPGSDAYPSTLYKPHFDRDNTLVHTDKPLPNPTIGGDWRPPSSLFEKHLEEFAVLPPVDETTPEPGEEWPLCVTDIRSYLFPGGPALNEWWDRPPDFAGCYDEPTLSAVGSMLKVLDHRVGWIKVGVMKGRVPMEVWLPLATTFTPCALKAGKTRLWLRSQKVTTFEVTDSSSIIVIGTDDLCRGGKLKEMIKVPPSLRPATQQKFVAECWLKPNPDRCREAGPEDPGQGLQVPTGLGVPDPGGLQPPGLDVPKPRGR